MRIIFTSQVYGKQLLFTRNAKFLLFLNILWTSFTLYFLAWDNVLNWNNLSPDKISMGLSSSSLDFSSFFTYWLFHYGQLHLLYIYLLSLLALTNNNSSKKQILILIFILVFLSPFVIYGLSYTIAFLLNSIGFGNMLNNLVSIHYLGASILAWGFVGLNRRTDLLVLIAFLFPFFYKILVSQTLDFTPDISHVIGYFTGSLISKKL
jgi:hypothetical protein